MRKLFVFTICAVIGAFTQAGVVEAAPIISVNGVPHPGIALTPETSTGGMDLYTFAINPNGGVYDAIDVVVTADAGLSFNSPSTNATFVAGNDTTAFLGLPTVGAGLTLVGTAASATQLSGVITTFGGPPVTSLNGDFLQVVGASGLRGTYQIQFALAGEPTLDVIQGAFGIPEPSTMLMAGMGLLGLVFRRRRNG
jgi:hypothetical protein